MTNILTLDYWFKLYPETLSTTGVYFFMLILAILLIIAIFFKLLIARSKERLHRRLYRRVLSFSMVNMIVFLVLFFLMFEAIPFLGSRFWLPFWLLADVYWLFIIFRHLKKIPGEKNKINKEREYQKYIP